MEKGKMRTIKDMKKAIDEAERKSDAVDEENEDVKKVKAKKPENNSPENETIDGRAAELAVRLEKAEELNKEMTDKYQRALAEYDNFRKRTAKEKAAMYGDGASDIIKQLLPVIDSFDRAMSSVSEEERGSSAYTGMSLIYKQLCQFMEAIGMTEAEAVGGKFNPEFHQALAHIEDPAHGENEIVEVLQKGYVLNDRIIRHSMVKVAN